MNTSQTRKNIAVSIVGDRMRFRLSVHDQDEAIDTVARSVYLMERIRKCVDEIEDRIDENDHLYGTVNVRLEDDGFVINWVTKEPWRFFERKYDLEGKPKGEPYAVRHR